MLLNGRALATDAAGNIPTLEAVSVDAAQPIAVAPYSIVFARISHFNVWHVVRVVARWVVDS